MARLIAALALVAAVTSACVPTRVTPGPTTTIVSTRTVTRPPSSAPPAYIPPPATSVAPLPPGARPAEGEVEKRCPYLASSPDQDAARNVADIIGSHVARTTVLTGTSPVGCRFYFYSGQYQAIADIVPRRFATASAAHDALVPTARAGGDALGVPQLAPGVDAILYRTRFFGPDGARDWACVFAAGRILVVVHSQQDNTSYSVRRLAATIAPKLG